MVDYHRTGNMEEHLLNSTSTSSLHHLRDLWKNPRGTVLRIQALALVAIIFSFFLAAYGSCRRWSNSWIVQKGFFVAHVLSLSLGTYSLGLMQSSLVKSEMYPIWTVSLFVLFGCIDPVTTYNGLDYKGPLSKVLYGICLNCGYVLLMSISTISSDVGNLAVCMLSAITFIKGFHMSLSLVQQSRMRNMVELLKDDKGYINVLRNSGGMMRVVDFPTNITGMISDDNVNLGEIESVLLMENKDELWSCYDVCVAFCLSHKLQRHFLGLSYHGVPDLDPETLNGIDYMWALRVIEIELAFLYEVFFTGNPFLNYYQAKAASLWALASFIGICFVGVATAIPGTMTSRRTTVGPAASGRTTSFVDTRTTDLAVTFVILISLALLQLMHLIRCWTSNWARVAVACAYARDRNKRWKPYLQEMIKRPYWLRCWMRLKLFVATCTNWFDKHLWQDKVGQYSLLPEGRLTFWGKKSRVLRKLRQRFVVVDLVYLAFDRLIRMLGLDYVWEVLWDLLGSDTTNKQPAIRLDDDVKASIISFLGQIETDRLDGNWLSFANKYPFGIGRYLPYFTDPIFHSESDGFRYTSFVMIWHIVTWYCELAVQEQEKQDSLGNVEKRIGCTGTAIGYLEKAAAALTGCCFKKAAAGGGEKEENRRNRHVSNVLSKYCTYLVVSAPELLPGPASETKRAYQLFLKSVMRNLDEDLWEKGEGDRPMSYHKIWERRVPYDGEFWYAIDLLRLLLGEDILLLDVRVRSDVWNVLVLVWVRMLVYAAPYGNVEVHKGRLSHGGEFITHLWALLYHLDIREWKIPEVQSIATVEDAKRILDDPVISVVAFLYSSSDHEQNELVRASRLEDSVKFYQTSNPDVAKCFQIDPDAKCPALVFLRRTGENFTSYDVEFHAYDIARFVSKCRQQGASLHGTTPMRPGLAPSLTSLAFGSRGPQEQPIFGPAPQQQQAFLVGVPQDQASPKTPAHVALGDGPLPPAYHGQWDQNGVASSSSTVMAVTPLSRECHQNSGAPSAGGEGRIYDIAPSLTVNKLALAEAQPQETATSILNNPIKEQGSEDDGAHTEDGMDLKSCKDQDPRP